MYVCMYVCAYYMSVWLYVHLGLGVPNVCRVPKWLSAKMAAVSYICTFALLEYLPRTTSNEHTFKRKQKQLQTIPQTMIEAAEVSILTISYSLSPKRENFTRTISLRCMQSQSHTHCCSPSLLSVSNSSANSIAATSYICYTLSCTWLGWKRQLSFLLKFSIYSEKFSSTLCHGI